MRSSLPPELWVGIECTRSRIRGRTVDQLVRTGHARRIGDLDLLAELGVGTIRYPLLWEHVEDPSGRREWGWADRRMRRLHALGLRPVLGLIHHGTGPAPGGILDPSFPERFADYAGAVARRYPWVDAYAPVNEPLTTARFAGLYGFWEPHRRDLGSFARLFVAQCRAAVLASEAIRAVRPDAEIYQCEDVGRVSAEPGLEAQAALENERRWLTFDVLSGRLTPDLPMWTVLREAGIADAELRWFLDHPMAPHALGIDHYVTSDRHLDPDVDAFPRWARSGNGIQRYANVETVRTDAEYAGFEGAVRDAHLRYGLPLFLGEVHTSGSREEQLRWLDEAWRLANRPPADACVLALNVWSAFGAYDWNSLMIREDGWYESGVFDVRSGRPEPTALARMVRGLTLNGSFRHPVLEGTGWWRRPDRVRYPRPRRVPASDVAEPAARSVIAVVPGRLAAFACAILRLRGLAYRVGTGPTPTDGWASLQLAVSGEPEALGRGNAAPGRPALVVRAPWLPTTRRRRVEIAAAVHRGLDLLVDGADGARCLGHDAPDCADPECPGIELEREPAPALSALAIGWA